MKERKTFYDIYETDVRPEITPKQEKPNTDMFDVNEDHSNSRTYTKEELEEIVNKKLEERLASMQQGEEGNENEEDCSNGNE